MNTTNLRFLVRQITGTGLGHNTLDLNGRYIDLEQALAERIPDGERILTLKSMTSVNENEVTTIIRLDKNPVTKYYDFHGYHVSVKRPESSQPLECYFKVEVYKTKGPNGSHSQGNPNITFAQAVKLLLGASIRKLGRTPAGLITEVWYILSPVFRVEGSSHRIERLDPHRGYAFELLAALEVLPIARVYDRKNLKNELERGERVLVPMEINNRSFTVNVEVNALERDLIITTKSGRRILGADFKELIDSGLKKHPGGLVVKEKRDLLSQEKKPERRAKYVQGWKQ